MLHRRRVFLGNDEIDLVARRVDRIGISEQIFRWHQSVQRIADFSKPVLDASQCVAVDAGLPTLRRRWVNS